MTLQTQNYPSTKQTFSSNVSCKIKIPSHHRLTINIYDISYSGHTLIDAVINGTTYRRLNGVYYSPTEFETENQRTVVFMDFISDGHSGITDIRIWIDASGKY